MMAGISAMAALLTHVLTGAVATSTPTAPVHPLLAPRYEPALGCDELLAAWCSACCPKPNPPSPLLARQLTRTKIAGKGGSPVFFWGCWTLSELEFIASAGGGGADDNEFHSSSSCGVLSEKEPRRYKNGEQRMLERHLRRCAAARLENRHDAFAPYGNASEPDDNVARAAVVAQFASECKPAKDAQESRKALAIAKGLRGYVYPPAQGCDEPLNAWCDESCPRYKDGAAPLLARKILPKMGATGGPYSSESYAWGCYPQSLLQEGLPPRHARLEPYRVSREPRTRFCGNLSSHTVQPVMNARRGRRRRFAPKGLEAALLRQDGLLMSIEEYRLGLKAKACIAESAARELRATLLRKPLSHGPVSAAREGYVVKEKADPRCASTAYVSVLTVSQWGNTFMSKAGTVKSGAAATNASSATQFQWALLLTLVRSIRQHERCHRDFLLLLGANVALPAEDEPQKQPRGGGPPRGDSLRTALRELSITIVRIHALDPTIPPLDHLHAWRLTAYDRIVVLDSDMLTLRPLDNLFTQTRRHPPSQLIMGHHAYDKAQSTCGLPVGTRGNGGLLVVRPNLEQFEGALVYVQRGLACGRTHVHRGPREAAGDGSTAAGAGLAGAVSRVQQATREAEKLRAMLEPQEEEGSSSSTLGQDHGKDGDTSDGPPGVIELQRNLLENPCFKEEQTGLVCWFTAQNRLRVLPCSYSWDVSNHLHMSGQQHHKGCAKKSEQAGTATCDAIAHHVASECTWDHVSSDAHIIHYKGKMKPWKHVRQTCFNVMHGRMTTMTTSSPSSFSIPTAANELASMNASTSAVVAPSTLRQLIAGYDRIVFNTGRCRVRTPLGDFIGVGSPVYWADGISPVNFSCCTVGNLLRAEWWEQARLVPGWSASRAVTPAVHAQWEYVPEGIANTVRNASAETEEKNCVPLEQRCDNKTGHRASTAVGGTVCVAAECGAAVDMKSMRGCSSRPGGRSRCCSGWIQRFADFCCKPSDDGCVLTPGVREYSK